jgi:hypothetical protein
LVGGASLHDIQHAWHHAPEDEDGDIEERRRGVILGAQVGTRHWDIVRILGGCPEHIIESMWGGAPEPDSSMGELSHLRAKLPSSHPRGQNSLFDFYTDFTKFQA